MIKLFFPLELNLFLGVYVTPKITI